MKRAVRLPVAVLLGLVVLVVQAFPWGSATHAYIGAKIGKWLPLMNANEMYGIMVPDLFNYSFDLNPAQYFTVQYYTHGSPGQEGFMSVWQKATWWGYQKSLAFGYVAHNDVWGVDWTAHHSGVAVGQGVGYMVFKAGQLLQTPIDIGYGSMSVADVFSMIGLSEPTDQLEFAHNLFETAGDIYLAQQDRLIGERMMGAAMLRSDDMAALLAKAMGAEWKPAIAAAEKEFRQSMVLYGATLIMDQETAITNLADQMAQLGVAYLAAKGLPPVDLALAKVLCDKVIRAALPLCSDYLTEVNATIGYVKGQLAAHNVRY